MTEESSYSKISQRILRLRWQAPVLALILVLVHQWVEHVWLIHLPRWQHFATQVAFYGFVGPILVWWALTSLNNRVRETEAAEQALKEAHQDLNEVNQRLEFLISVNRRLSEALDEETLIETVLELPLDIVPALGCSLIRYDERQQPLPPVHRGELNPAAFEAWTAHLSNPEIREACQHCESHQSVDTQSCPLFANLPPAGIGEKMYCLELSRGKRFYGMLNLYFPDSDHPTTWEESLLKSMANEVSLALENIHWRTKELATLYRIQQARQLDNLHGELEDVLEHVIEALDIEGGMLFMTDDNREDLNLITEVGHPLGESSGLVKSLAMGSFQAQAPYTINDLKQEENSQTEGMSLLVAPLRAEAALLGCMLLWSQKANTFTRRRSRLVEMIAGQAALLVENHRLYLQAEHQAALAERARLAREIHDGLAQTLGYLKLRVGQISGWLRAGDNERAGSALEGVRELINNSYLDAREAIDGLRLKPEDGDLAGWMDRIVNHFHKLSAIPIKTSQPPVADIPTEVQVQLLRIVQEALGNIRKHADATQVHLDWQLDGLWLTLSISDNGRGFDPDDVPPIARHGLHIMQERAELLDADFQIISQPDAGTQVVIRIPRRMVGLTPSQASPSRG